MLQLDLMEGARHRGLSLVLAAVVADQVASGLGLHTRIAALDDALAVSLPDASDRLRDVFVAHLERRLGDGFTVALVGAGVISVDLDIVEQAAPDTDENLTAGSTAPSTMLNSGDGAEPRRRPGRPPGSKTRPTEPVQP